MDREIYIAENGLEYCTVCNEPLEQFLPENVQAIFGMTKHPRQCACIRERIDREAKERKEREHKQTVESNTSVCFEERKMREWNFEKDNGRNPDMKFAKYYVEHWAELKKEGHGLILWGGVGSDKSYMAACIANALLEQEERVLMTNFATIINTKWEIDIENCCVRNMESREEVAFEVIETSTGKALSPNGETTVTEVTSYVWVYADQDSGSIEMLQYSAHEGMTGTTINILNDVEITKLEVAEEMTPMDETTLQMAMMLISAIETLI